MSRPLIQFVTGRLAEPSLQQTLDAIAQRADFDFTIDVLPITVAALMTPKWIARHITIDPQATQIVIPGYCDADLSPIRHLTTIPVDRGPRDLRMLPEFFGQADPRRQQFGAYDIAIIAEINHAPRLPLAEIVAAARRLSDDGADMIDVGCEPGDPWNGVGDCVRALRDEGHRVSIDSLNPKEIEPAIRSGAELVLSVNSSNCDAALDWNVECVVIPDDIPTLGGLETTIDRLASKGIALRIDPILEPIGCGFASSLGRYLEVRQRYPDAEMMMGTGNLTELTDVDSAGVNVLLLGICQELGVRSILTTQVINWARTSVAECDLARRLVHFAIANRTPPKHLAPGLVMLRDEKLLEFGEQHLAALAGSIKDKNYRLFAEGDQLHLVSAGMHLTGRDPFKLFSDLIATRPANIDPSHAFYLGYEMAKAATALTLGKQYQQDEALDWGMLTAAEQHHRLQPTRERKHRK